EEIVSLGHYSSEHLQEERTSAREIMRYLCSFSSHLQPREHVVLFTYLFAEPAHLLHGRDKSALSWRITGTARKTVSFPRRSRHFPQLCINRVTHRAVVPRRLCGTKNQQTAKEEWLF